MGGARGGDRTRTSSRRGGFKTGYLVRLALDASADALATPQVTSRHVDLHVLRHATASSFRTETHVANATNGDDDVVALVTFVQQDRPFALCTVRSSANSELRVDRTPARVMSGIAYAVGGILSGC